MNNNTTPELRPDYTGKMVTRHVRVSRPTSGSGNIPAPGSGGNPMPVIQAAMSKHVSPEMLQRTLRGSSPRQQAAIRDALTRSDKEVAPLLATAMRQGGNAGIVSSLATVFEKELFADEKGNDARFKAFMGAIRDASVIGGCGTGVDRVAEERPEVQENVKMYVYLSASAGQPLNSEIADLALRSEHDFDDVLDEVVRMQSVDAVSIAAGLGER